ncbi:hypothetical protein N7528_007424 [Penicillium herquei]|nr:hypothetical protein N7528_007424 [Penicillium herquei]
MSFDPQTFYRQRAEIISALDTIRAIMIRFRDLLSTQNPLQDPNFGKLIDNIHIQIATLLPCQHNPNHKRFERCAYKRAITTLVWFPEMKIGLRDAVLRDWVMPELLVMIAMQIGRVRLRGMVDKEADEMDRQASELDVKYQPWMEPDVNAYFLLRKIWHGINFYHPRCTCVPCTSVVGSLSELFLGRQES